MTNQRRRRRNKQKRSHHLDTPSNSLFAQPFLLPERPFTLLDKDQIELLHNASLQILEKTGILFRNSEAVAHFRAAGAKIDGERVYLERKLVMACVSHAPSEYTLHARNPNNSVCIGGRSCAVMPGGGPANTIDLDGVRRAGRLMDLENFAKLSQMSPHVHVMARKAVEAQDLPEKTRHLTCWHSILTLTDKPAQSGFVNGAQEAEDALAMLAIVFGGEENITDLPVAHCSVNANSPLLFDFPMLESLLLFARYGQPILISPFVMAGVTGPTTMAGSLAQHHAEVLAGLTLVQLVRPGTPVLYGTATSNIDMRNANPAIGSPESVQSIVICSQLARLCNLPCRGGGALTDSPIPDAQSSYERAMTLQMSLLSGVHFIMHGLGILESYLTLGYTQFVMDLELLEMLHALLNPVDISDETLALETIHEVGPGGYFLEAAHTIKHYRQAHFIPQISLRQPYEQWVSAGGHDATERARVRCLELLENYQMPAIDSKVADGLANFIDHRLSHHG